jgi:hypothetical protein
MWIPILILLLGAPAEPVSAAHPTPTGGEADTAAARAAFARFRALEGRWVGRSTRGWEEEVTWRVIAGGSAVMQTSFDAHPGETMVTLVALDCGRLGLTHYCVAGNQPRLVATRFSSDGREVAFTFRDGGNLASRDVGHMDQVVYRFVDDDRITGRWTWYQNGRERWLEEIELHRVP